MKFWLFLSNEPPETLQAHARMAEEHGYYGVAMADHVAIPAGDRTEHPTKFPIVAEHVYSDQLISFAWMAAVTMRLRFLTYIYVVPMRDPFTVAKQFGTAALLTSDRVILGTGVGWLREEFDALGHDFATRGKRMDEMLDVMHDFWDDGYAEHHGKHYDFARMGMFPAPRRRVPVWVGGQPSAPAVTRRAAKHDGFMPIRAIDQLDRLDEETRAGFAVIDQLRRAQGLNGPYHRCVGLNRAIKSWEAGDARRLAEVDGVTDLVVWPWSDPSLPFDEKWRAGTAFAEQVIRQF